MNGGYIRPLNLIQMQRTSITTMALLGVALLTGCYPDTPDSIEEYDLVYTNFAPDFDFKAETTYALPDSVVKVTGNLQQGELPEMVNPVYANPLLARIRDNMNTYGWTEVDEANSPDVIVLPSAISTTTVIISDPGYWGWYYPWYGGWYYPGYYPPTISSYSTGSLVIQMVDPNDLSATDSAPVVWVAAVNGLMEGSTSSIVSRINQSVDRVFDQSEYLQQ